MKQSVNREEGLRLLNAMAPAKAKPKYRNKKVVLGDGTVIDSIKEAKHIVGLRQQQKLKLISDLKEQVPFAVVINGKKICKYVADAEYVDKSGVRHVIDVKSVITRKNQTYRLKKKLVEAVFGITIEEV